jgi:hypothetical protein
VLQSNSSMLESVHAERPLPAAAGSDHRASEPTDLRSVRALNTVSIELIKHSDRILLGPDSLRIDVQAFENDSAVGSEDEIDDDDWKGFDDEDGADDMLGMALDDDPADFDWLPVSLRARVLKKTTSKSTGEHIILFHACETV